MWRKALRQCKFLLCTFLFAVLNFSENKFVYAQTSVSGDDSFPSITMPSISTPSIGGGFYVPGNSHNRAASDTQNNKAAKNNEEKKIGENKIQEDISSLKSSITAMDLSALNNLGLLDSLNSSMGINTDSAQVLLTKLLKEMEELKQKNEKAAEEYKSKTASDTPAANLVISAEASNEIHTEEKKAEPRATAVI